MRSNTIFVILIVLLAGLVAGIALRGRESHQAAAPIASAAALAGPEGSASTSASGNADASALPTTSGSAAPDAPPSLTRPLRVVSLGWELAAAGVMANDGAEPGKKSAFKEKKLDVRLDAKTDVSHVENALARGGKDDNGADIAIMSLPRFVASYERLKALNPVIFFVVGWSEGHDVVMSKKASFDDLPPRGNVKLAAEAGDAAAFLGLFALDLEGCDPERVELVDEGAEWIAMQRSKSKSKSEQIDANLLLTTGEASRLVPYVAIAQAALVEQHRQVLTTFASVWLEGHKLVARDASEAARKIAEAQGAPEPLEVLSALGEIAPASLAENARVAGLSGRGAATLEALFGRSWDIWRRAKVLTIPPEHAPINGTVIAALVRAGGDLAAPDSTTKRDKPNTGGKPLLVHRLPRGELDERALAETVGFIAGVFPRSPIKVSAHPRFALDKKKSQAVIDAAVSEHGVAKNRLTVGAAPSKNGAIATVEVMPVP